MARPSNIESLPAAIKSQLVSRLFDSGFTDYAGHADWINSLGFEISKSGIQRFGASIENSSKDYDVRLRVVEAASRYSNEVTIIENSTSLLKWILSSKI